ncbi:Dihydroorotase [Aliarcobacter thereius]|uniref:Dihydroorotase n=2 Tax=Aliarcobacter thereius TaxID=544718 RepID=A0A5R9H8R8_9BACT|nr:dihydroorotase [Aliarcobacter thereius]OCL88581.1 Dihydroorotase [Aliarcobacter thereius]OCL92075.1 Dihydroorotase [Aliarcobacter thereius]OCL94829.1 Dihydroorotase [Aliarcobacter thereius LMG 24486]QBF15296.1 dihydroorotase, homodimeric type [Aliarcobacter thereius LMG 24486]TLS72482.1 dihydroorotase [Aliarcobacter thereius]
MSKIFEIEKPLDMHLHLRDNDMLKLVAPFTSKSFSAALVMPNLVPPITTKDALLAYKDRIDEVCKGDNFQALMTLFFKNDYSFEFLEDIKDDIIGIKLYPAGITTNSETGVSSMDIEVLRPTLESMSKLGIPLCIHGETNGFVMDREKEFMPIYESIAKAFPNLKIIMEHITTKDAVELLDKYSNLYATVTLHHLIITLDDLAGGMLDPHLFCKPIAKRPEDKEALLSAALKAHPKLMFGSDSAPHPKHKKECCGCAAGVFTSSIALQVLVELFEKNDALDKLNDFVSNNAQRIYGLKLKEKTIRLIKKDFVVPAVYEYKDEKVVPMYAGKTISWSIKE